MKRAVYAASFDPITNGHLWVIEQGVKLFDELVVAIGVNPDKRYTFSLDEKLTFVKEAIRRFPNVVVDSYENQFLVTYAKSIGVDIILRGIRTQVDYEYERAMRNINSDLDSNIVTIFIIPPREIAEISSSVVKGLVGPEGWENLVQKYVPKPVHQKFIERFSSEYLDARST